MGLGLVGPAAAAVLPGNLRSSLRLAGQPAPGTGEGGTAVACAVRSAGTAVTPREEPSEAYDDSSTEWQDSEADDGGDRLSELTSMSEIHGSEMGEIVTGGK